MKINSVYLLFIVTMMGIIYLPEVALCQETPYRVEPVYPPLIQRPPVEVSREMLPKGTMGTLPLFDGESFHLNLEPFQPDTISPKEARTLVDTILPAINWTRSRDELQYVRTAVNPAADAEYIDQQIKEGEEETYERLKERLNLRRLNRTTKNSVREMSDELRQRASQEMRIFAFGQFYKKVPFDNTGLRVIWRSEEGFVALNGRIFNIVKFTNAQRLDSSDAKQAAEEYIKRFTKVLPKPHPNPLLVILPYGEGFRYAWKMDITAEEGPYRIWIDAENGKVLQLIPQFASNSDRGLVFDPDPNAGTTILYFQVDPPANGQYRLELQDVLDVDNAGADGVCSNDLTITDDGSGEANFNISPINGIVVDRTSSTGYNCRFQDVNAYAWIYHYRQWYLLLGSQPFPAITATVNHNNPCGFGIDNACASTAMNLVFGIGTATTSNSTNCSHMFNGAIDATVIAHECGHLLNWIQYGGTTVPRYLNEGLADFWAYTYHNTDMFGSYWGTNCTTPDQDGWIPRQAEAQDVFPDHRALATGNYADGQILSWALWSSRTELLDATAFGALSINLNLIDALSTAGVGILTGTTDKRVHDTYVNLLQQLATNYSNSRAIHKILSGFARAGIYLSDRDAVIDIDDDYLNRNDATGSNFTIWTGRDYTFNANETVNTANMPFNTRFEIEVASDADFTQNLVSSGVSSGVTAGAGGSASWMLPTADWNILKVENQLYYRVETIDNTGGNQRSSRNPGNGFLVRVPPARAIINETGEEVCCTIGGGECALGGATAPRSMALLPLFPLFMAILWRRKLKRYNHDI